MHVNSKSLISCKNDYLPIIIPVFIGSHKTTPQDSKAKLIPSTADNRHTKEITKHTFVKYVKQETCCKQILELKKNIYRLPTKHARILCTEMSLNNIEPA